MALTATRALASLAVFGFASLGMVATADAATCTNTADYGTTACSGTTGSSTVTPGGTTTVTGTGFTSGSTVAVTVCGEESDSLTADDSGTVSGTVTIPSDASGSCTITLTGPSSSGGVQVVSLPVTVSSAAAGAADPGLPFTGFELGAASVLGAGLLGAGTIAVLAGRKRKDGLAAA